jgi:hypothetical protein
VLLIAAAALPLTAFAQEPVVVDAHLSPTRATVGDHLTLSVTVEHEADTTIELPGAEAAFAPLELVEATPPEVHSLGDDHAETRLTFVLTAFQTGDLTVPPLAIDYRTGGGDVASLTTPSLPLVVDSVIPSGQTPDEIRDLKPQAALAGAGVPVWVWATLVTAGCLIVTAATYVVMRYALREPEAEPPAPPPPQPPDETARAELDRLAGLDPQGPNELRESYRHLAACLRRYLSDRFGFPAFAMTTQELEGRMRELGVETWPARLIGGLLQECDAVQFAKYVPAPERARTDLTTAYEIVELTRSRSAPPEEVEAKEGG